ncbi:hypothetical protein FF38_00565 [Lucilia cuprina]|uniref:Uncharacterized protein n=1 Tax=Lucilia cuprina TaxID=7375 RepID=A0A0L0CF67_LUCCU|nr:hypothetical protein FF38_00565 [Lucilia cuprina]
MDKFSDLYCLLNKWNLSHLYDRLKEQGITVDVFHMLKSNHIERLFVDSQIGDMVKFEYNLDEWKKSLNKSETYTSQSNQVTTKISIMEILKCTHNGREILDFYKKNETLHEEQRNLLLNTIIKYIEANGVVCSLSDCSEMEKEICSIFPSEELDFYRSGKRGKIYNKLANLKRLSKDVLKKCESKPDINTLEESEENYTLYLQYLQSEQITAEEFDIYWRRCAPFRFKQISESQTTAEIFKLWPDYIKPSGFHLIDIDFALKFPMAKNLHERWPKFSEQILCVLKTKISSAYISKKLADIESKNDESKTFMIFWFLHNLFPPQLKVSTESSGAKIRKKYSIADSQEGFAIIANTLEELEVKIKLLKLQCRNIQPRLLIIGEICNIKSIFVFVDNVKYPILTFLNALDYPEESDVFYNFIQSFLYDLPTTKKYSKVSTIKHEILNIK